MDYDTGQAAESESAESATSTGEAPSLGGSGDLEGGGMGDPSGENDDGAPVDPPPDGAVLRSGLVADWPSGDAAPRSLPTSLQQAFGASLGADLGGVRIHTGAAAAESAGSLGARAYTVGSDIYFADGGYDPDSPAGQHLLAHEVAHTVQQSGAATAPQCKLEVSAPGDAHEVEADRAADAMVTGAPASVSPAGAGIARKTEAELGGSVSVGDQGLESVTLTDTIKPPSIPLKYFKVEPSVGFALKLARKKPSDDGAAAGGGGPGISGGASKGEDGPAVKAEVEQQLGQGKWGFDPKVDAEMKLDSQGPHFSLGLTFEHDEFDWKGITVGPLAIHAPTFEWKPGSFTPEVTLAGLEGSVTLPYFSYKGWDLTGTLTLGGELKPDLEAIGKDVALRAGELLVGDAAGAAAAIAIPLGSAVVMLVGWAEAGHEFDEASDEIQGLWNQCKAAGVEAMGGPHIAVGFMGKDLAANVSDLAAQSRASLAAALNMPEAAVVAASQAKPELAAEYADEACRIAWTQHWPAVKAAIMKQHADDGDHLQWQLWLDAHDNGF